MYVFIRLITIDLYPVLSKIVNTYSSGDDMMVLNRSVVLKNNSRREWSVNNSFFLHLFYCISMNIKSFEINIKMKIYIINRTEMLFDPTAYSPPLPFVERLQ